MTWCAVVTMSLVAVRADTPGVKLSGPKLPGAKLPGGAMAFVEMDPSGFGPTTAWLASMLRTLDAAGVVRAEDRGVADTLLAATILGSYPHTIALLDLKAQRFVPGKVEIDKLQAVLVLDAPGRSPDLLRTLRTILLHYGTADMRQQTTIDLPGGRQAVRYRLADWPAWMALEWTADARTFVLGIGEGSLQQWHDRDGGDDAHVAAHVAAMAHLPAGDATRPRMLRGFADLLRLRAAAPTLFRTGRLTPMLDALGLDDADRVMLQARWKDSFLVLAGTAQRGDRTTAAALSLDHWPDDAGVPMPPGAFHLVAPMDGPIVARRLNALIRMMRNDDDWDDYDRFVATHYGDELDRLTDHVARYRPLLLVSDHPKAWLPVPGTATAYLVLREDAAAEMAAGELQMLLAPAVRTPDDPPDAVAIVTDPATGVQWLDSPMRSLFKSPAWGWHHRVLIASYSPLAVLENQRWLGDGAAQARIGAHAGRQP